jgi:transposase
MLHLEVRKKIIEARKNAVTVREICKAYTVKKTAVYNLLKQERETGDITPRTHNRGRKPTLIEDDLSRIENLLTERKDITAAEVKELLNLPLCESSICKIIRNKLGYRFKKRQYMPANGNGQT